MSPGWWAPVAEFSSLREFGVVGFAHECQASEADAFAEVLTTGLPSLSVLDLGVFGALIIAVLRRGLPSNLKVLGVSSYNYEFADLLAALPLDLVALRAPPREIHSAADVCTLLSRCPQLHAIDLRCDDEAVAYLVSGNVDRSLILKDLLFGRLTIDALATAGHKVGELQIGVHWRICGGVAFEGKAAGV